MAQAQSVDRPPRLPLVVTPSNRDDTVDKDARLVNCYVETSGEEGAKEYYLCKRPGTLVNTALTAAAGSGIYNWRANIYAVAGTKFYKDGVDTGTVDATGGVYKFSSCLGATPKLVLGNGKKGYTYDAGAGLVEITDADFFDVHVKGWAFLNGTTYYMTSDAVIRGSGINDPQSWDALNKIIAQIEPDGGVALAKQLVYVIALKEWTSEVFYDAANATGTPLGRVEGARINFGCASADSVQDIDGDLIWAAVTRSGGAKVVLLRNLKSEIVSTKAIERLLNNADFSAIASWQFNHDGHMFYGLTLKNSNLTLVFDLSVGRWSQWTASDGTYFPMVSSTFTTTQRTLMQHETNGKIYLIDSNYVTDDSSLITVDIYTPTFDGGTRRRKTLSFMEFIGDQVDGSALSVRTNDYDYDPKRWSEPRVVNLAAERPHLADCGTFVKRAHHLQHKKATRMRLQAVEMQLDIGTL